jgi:hypothetical protein
MACMEALGTIQLKPIESKLERMEGQVNHQQVTGTVEQLIDAYPTLEVGANRLPFKGGRVPSG